MYKAETDFHPTTVVVAPSGEIFVGDGYGQSYCHKYDANHKYVKTFGGPGKMQCPHGMWIDTRSDKPTLIVADRENHRLQIFDLDCNLQKMVTEGLRRPSNFGQLGSDLAIADLEGRVTILDKDFKLVTHLGDNPDPNKRAQNGVPSSQWRDGEFVSPLRPLGHGRESLRHGLAVRGAREQAATREIEAGRGVYGADLRWSPRPKPMEAVPADGTWWRSDSAGGILPFMSRSVRFSQSVISGHGITIT